MMHNAPLRIAHLAFSALPATVGGLETVVDTLIREQRAMGHDVTLVTRWKQLQGFDPERMGYPALALMPNPKFGGAAFEKVGPRWPTALSVGWHQLRHRFDVWHAHWLYPTGWMAEGMLRTLGTPIIMTAHGADVQVDETTGHGFRRFPRHDARLRQMISRHPKLTGVSQGIVHGILELGAPADCVQLIPNGVSVSAFRNPETGQNEIRAELGIPSGSQIVLTVGRNQPSKGLHHIPKVLKLLLRHGRNVCWVIVGPRAEELGPAFEKEGLAKHVRLIGPVRKEAGEDPVGPPRRLVALYKSADMMIFPTHSEAFGLVALEAMAAGLPVIASDIPGLRAFITHGRNGLLVPVADTGAFAEAALRLISDPDLRASLSAAGKLTAQAHDWPAITERYVALYRRVIEETRA